MGPNNFFRRFRSNSSNNNYYIANNYPTGTTASEPKSKTKLLIIVVIVAVVLISIFAVIGSVTKHNSEERQKREATAEEITETINDIKLSYEILLELYDKSIGFSPKLSYTEYHFFPSGNFADLKVQLDNLSGDLEELSQYDIKKVSQNSKQAPQNLESLVEKLQTNLASLSTNINTMAEFYEAFYRPTFDDENLSETCVETDDMKKLISSKSNYVSSSATKYETAFCELATFMYDGFTYDEKELFYTDNQGLIKGAINDLNKALETKREEDLKIDDWGIFEDNKED